MEKDPLQNSLGGMDKFGSSWTLELKASDLADWLLKTNEGFTIQQFTMYHLVSSRASKSGSKK